MMSDATLTLVQNIMGPVGAVLASAMFLSSIPVMRYIMSTKGVGEYSCFPYVVQTCNCALWTTYSITYWQGGKMLWPLLTNGLGLLIASVSLLVYLCFCGRDALRGLVPYYSPVVLATAAFCVYALVTMTDTVAMVAGDFCLVINMIMYLGPCAGIRAAITTRSTEFLPLTLGISTITCSLPWFFFGVSIANLTIWLPNACGIVFGTVQVIVFAWLSRTTPPGQEAGTSCVSSMNADGTMHPKLQHFATSGDIFSFVGSKVEARTLRSVRTWGGTPLCMLADGQDDAEAALPRANSAPSPAVTPKVASDLATAVKAVPPEALKCPADTPAVAPTPSS